MATDRRPASPTRTASRCPFGSLYTPPRRVGGPGYFTGARALSSSNQLSTTLICADARRLVVGLHRLHRQHDEQLLAVWRHVVVTLREGMDRVING